MDELEEEGPRGELGCGYFLGALAIAIGGPYLMLLSMIFLVENCRKDSHDPTQDHPSADSR